MAPLPVNTTKRYFLRYADGLAEHTMMIRVAPSINDALVSTVLNNFLGSLAPILFLVTITGLEVAQAGSDIRNPAVWGGAPTYGGGVATAVHSARSLCFLGRSTDGRRARLFVFSGSYGTPTDWRLTSAENGSVAAAIAALNAAPLTFLSISGNTTVKYPYADVNFNSYWERAFRS